MGGLVQIASSAQWNQVLGSSPVVIADFYADWCGPCKMIAPTFESLATKYSKPGRITFCKVNVDQQRDVAQRYGVRAMPTFLVLHSRSVVDTIQGANPPALTAAVEKAVKLAGAASAPAFGTGGRRLGGPGVGSARTGGGGGRGGAVWSSWRVESLIKALIAFFGLYLVSLFSLDAYKAAEDSQFNKHRRPPPEPIAKPGSSASKPTNRPTFKTMADL